MRWHKNTWWCWTPWTYRSCSWWEQRTLINWLIDPIDRALERLMRLIDQLEALERLMRLRDQSDRYYFRWRSWWANQDPKPAGPNDVGRLMSCARWCMITMMAMNLWFMWVHFGFRSTLFALAWFLCEIQTMMPDTFTWHLISTYLHTILYERTILTH